MRQSLERALSGLTSDMSTDVGCEASGYDAGGYGRRYSFGSRPSIEMARPGRDVRISVEAGRRSGAFEGAKTAAARRSGASFERSPSLHSSHRLLSQSSNSAMQMSSTFIWECHAIKFSRLDVLPRYAA